MPLSRKTKRALRIGSFSIITLILLIIGCSLYLQWYSLEAQGNARGKNTQESYEYIVNTYPQIKSWADSMFQHQLLKDTFIQTDDGIQLHALYAFADTLTPRTAVIVHGYTDNAIRMLHIGYMYHHDLRYNILLPDLRFSGKSGGDHLQMGWNDRIDVLHWMDIANQLFATHSNSPETQMVVHGISMGGATIMCVSGEPQKSYVKCYIDDCGFTSVWDEFAGELKNQFGLPEFPLLHVASWLTDIRYGWNFKEAAPIRQIRQSTSPMLFIHGEEDTFVPTWMGDSLYQTKPGVKSYWKTPRTQHAASYRNYPREYTEQVKNFTEKFMN